MVGADALEGDALVRALKAGRFYASSGVFLDRIAWDPRSRRLSLSIRPEDGVTYTTELIGTHKGYNAAAAEGKTGIGEVLASATGAEVVLTVPDDALFARATVTASARSKNPAYEGQKKQAWTQPVGWR